EKLPGGPDEQAASTTVVRATKQRFEPSLARVTETPAIVSPAATAGVTAPNGEGCVPGVRSGRIQRASNSPSRATEAAHSQLSDNERSAPKCARTISSAAF